MSIWNVFCAWDLLTPAAAFVQDFVNRPAGGFVIDPAGGWDRQSVKRLLQANGIRCWGLMYTPSGISVSVLRGQAAQARQVLERHGVPIRFGG